MWANLPDFSEGFKSASTGLDGKQYFVPIYFYPWAVHYRQSLFDEKGYEIPTTWDEFKALCDQMKADGIIPLAAANDGGWPQMGMFDMLNLRVNGYDFHISLMGGKESWTDDKVTDVFTHWSEITDFYQPDVTGRTWQDAATALGNKEVGMFLLGTFIANNFDAATQQDIIDDITFFPFPEINPEHRPGRSRGTHRRVHDGRRTRERRGCQGTAYRLGSGGRDRCLARRRPVSRCGQLEGEHQRHTTRCSRSRWNSSARRSRSPSSSTVTPSPTSQPRSSARRSPDFLSRSARSTAILATVEEQKQTYTFE